MAAGDAIAPDWRDAAAYRPLLDADRSFLAWEWLRRDPAYRSAADCEPGATGQAGSGPAAPERWGLHAFEPAHQAAPHARPIWSADVDPFVLGVEAVPSTGDDAFDLGRSDAVSTLVPAADGREHLLISDGLRAIRIDVAAGTIADGPAELRFRLNGLASAERPVLTLRRLLAFCRTGRFCRSLHAREARARRWVLMLRARDALAAGAGQREMAAVLFSAEADQPRWRSQSPSLRSQAQRLVRGARHLASGGYLELLR